MTIKNKLKQYLKADRKVKSEILNQLEADTGRSRKSLIRSLKTLQMKTKRSKSPGRPVKYTPRIKLLLKDIWIANDEICAERFHLNIPDTMKALDQENILKQYTEDEIEIALRTPLGTLKKIVSGFSKSKTKIPKSKGNPFESQRKIPIRTQFEKNITYGFFGIDFVDHTGGDSSGTYARTLNCHDSKTTLIQRAACLGKSRKPTEQAFDKLVLKINYKMKGIHSDNEANLLYVLLKSKAKSKRIFISRTRSYKAEDNGHVEQKNGDKIRNLVGYYRYDTKEAVNLLNEIYELDDLYQNHFIRSVRLEKKKYNDLGKVVKRVYSDPKTAYERILEDPDISYHYKSKYRKEHDSLNMIELKRERDKLIRKLFRIR